MNKVYYSNTLNKNITHLFFSVPDGREVLESRWKTLIESEQAHELTGIHFLVYQVLRGKDWRKCFADGKKDPSWHNATPCKLHSAIKELSELNYATDVLVKRKGGLKHLYFLLNGIVDEASFQLVQSVLPNLNSTINALHVPAYIYHDDALVVMPRFTELDKIYALISVDLDNHTAPAKMSLHVTKEELMNHYMNNRNYNSWSVRHAVGTIRLENIRSFWEI